MNDFLVGSVNFGPVTQKDISNPARPSLWFSVDDRLPELKMGDYGWLVSDQVLAFGCGRYNLATYEEGDDCFPPSWRSDDNDRGNITNQVKFWRHLPPPPEFN